MGGKGRGGAGEHRTWHRYRWERPLPITEVWKRKEEKKESDTIRTETEISTRHKEIIKRKGKWLKENRVAGGPFVFWEDLGGNGEGDLNYRVRCGLTHAIDNAWGGCRFIMRLGKGTFKSFSGEREVHKKRSLLKTFSEDLLLVETWGRLSRATVGVDEVWAPASVFNQKRVREKDERGGQSQRMESTAVQRVGKVMEIRREIMDGDEGNRIWGEWQEGKKRREKRGLWRYFLELPHKGKEHEGMKRRAKKKQSITGIWTSLASKKKRWMRGAKLPGKSTFSDHGINYHRTQVKRALKAIERRKRRI